MSNEQSNQARRGGSVASAVRVLGRPLVMARNNKAAMRALGQLLRGGQQRDQALLDLMGVLLRKLVDPRISEGRASAKGFAQRLMEMDGGPVAHLASVNHFGVLSRLVPLNISRQEYVFILLSELMRIRNEHINLGLSARNTGVHFGREELSGLELLQAWAVLHNGGHLHGTFATERAILQMIHESPLLKKEFLATIDPTLRTLCNTLVDEGDPNRFHYALAASMVTSWRPNATRRAALACLEAHLDERASLKKKGIFAIYRRARQLAYGALHRLAIPSTLPFGFHDEQPRDCSEHSFWLTNISMMAAQQQRPWTAQIVLPIKFCLRPRSRQGRSRSTSGLRSDGGTGTLKSR